MSTTVKVFLVLILLMNLCIMWTTMTLYATRENWKRRWDLDTKELSGRSSTPPTRAARISPCA